MSAAPTASTLDWNVVAAAVAVFLGTLITTVLGVLRGRKEVKKQLSGESSPTFSSAIIQDNQSVRESTVVSKELRDQLLLNHHSADNLARHVEDLASVERQLLAEVRLLREVLDKRV